MPAAKQRKQRNARNASEPVRESERDRNDRQGGRQLGYLLIPAGAVLLGAAIYISFGGDFVFSLEIAVLGAFALGFGCYAFVKPAFVLRLAMGRWAELHDRPADALEKVQEGVPAPVAALESALTVERRARLGRAGMLVAVVLVAASVLAFVLDASSRVGAVLLSLSAPLGVGGLILWYRTK